jgi:hypothetical protein
MTGLTLLISLVMTPPEQPRDEQRQSRAACEAHESAFACEVYEQVRNEIPAVGEDEVELPVNPRHVPPRLSAEWLTGYWVSSKGQCYGGDFGLNYDEDGRFSDYWFSGRYRLRGNRIAHRVEKLTDSAEPGDKVGQRFTRRVRLAGPNEIMLSAGREWERLYRCPAGGMPVTEDTP